jgi:hypothetical protein
MRGGTKTKKEYQNGTYDGEVNKRSERHGQGTFIYTDGRTYVGMFKNDMMHGEGTFTYPDGRKYVGMFKDDMKDGEGTFTFPNGQIQEGMFSKNVPHGKGKLSNSKTGEYYDGDFVNNMKQGSGTYKFANGDKYVGEWKDDNINGSGKMTYNDGYVYDGEWMDGKKHGKGTYNYPDGETTYEGEFKYDKLSGLGVYKHVTPDYVFEYRGNHEDGFRHGEGIIKTIYKGKIERMFVTYNKEQMISGKGRRIEHDGTIEEGEFENKKIIIGKRTGPNNAYTYEGTFDTNEKPLKGVMTVYNEPVNDESRSWIWTYTGRYLNGKRHGYGKMTWSNGQIYEGMWKDDEQSPGEGEYMKIQPEEAQIRTRYKYMNDIESRPARDAVPRGDT